MSVVRAHSALHDDGNVVALGVEAVEAVPAVTVAEIVALAETEEVVAEPEPASFDLEEASTLAALRFYSSRSAAFRPSIRLTYVPRVNFGAP